MIFILLCCIYVIDELLLLSIMMNGKPKEILPINIVYKDKHSLQLKRNTPFLEHLGEYPVNRIFNQSYYN